MQHSRPVPQLLRSVAASLADFGAWWREELLGLVPRRLRRWLGGERARIVLVEVPGGFQAWREPGTALSPSSPLHRDPVDALASLGAPGRAAGVAIRLPLERCFVRHVELPAALRADLDRVLGLDLERATPFKLKELYTAHQVEGRTGNQLHIRQLVAKRAVVDPLLADVRQAGFEVAAVDCWSDQPSAPLGIDLLAAEGGNRGARGGAALPVALGAVAALLLAAALVLAPWRYESALAELRGETTRARTEAAAVRGQLEQSRAAIAGLERLQQLRLTHVSVLDVVEEITRLLPDDVWLTSLRMEGDIVDISGLAKSGAALPQLFEGSGILTDAALTAPLTLDPREDKERFSLRVQVRQRQARSARAEQR